MDKIAQTKFLDYLRRSQGLTQAQVAEQMGISRPHLTEIYQGKKSITQDLLDKFAEVHGVQAWEIKWAVESGGLMPSNRIITLWKAHQEVTGS